MARGTHAKGLVHRLRMMMGRMRGAALLEQPPQRGRGSPGDEHGDEGSQWADNGRDQSCWVNFGARNHHRFAKRGLDHVT